MNRLTLISLASLAVVGAAQAQNLIVNGGFENGSDSFSLNGNVQVSTYSAYVAGAGGTGTGPGESALVFNGGDLPNGNSASQSFATVSGQTYDVSFLFGNFGVSESQVLTVTLLDGATPISSSVFTDGTGDTNFGTLYQAGGLQFTATGILTTIVLGDNTSGTVNSDLFVDNLSVEAVPEPASMAVLGLGLAALKRRRKNG